MSAHAFTPEELAAIQAQVDRRWGAGKVELAPANVELLLHGEAAPPSECPAVSWSAGGCTFVIHKVAADRYRCNFFYTETQQYGTGIDEFVDAGECALTLLRVQADHEAARAGVAPGARPPAD